MTSSATMLTIAAINCRGVRGRVDKINEFLNKERGVSVMVLSETWLKEGDSAPRFEGCEVVVDERGVVSAGASRASGGLIVLTRMGLNVKVHRSSRDVAVLSVGEVRVIGCYFRPYHSEENETGSVKDKVFREHWETLEGEVALHGNTVIVGDFNAHGLQADTVNYPRGGFLKKRLGQVVERVTPKQGKWTTFNLQGGKGINDHVFVALGNPLQVEAIVHEKESLGGSDHRLITLTVELPQLLEVPEGILRWDLKAVDKMKDKIQEELLRSNPDQDLQALEERVSGWARDGMSVPFDSRQEIINEGWALLKRWLQEALLKHVRKKKSLPSYRKDFLTPEMLRIRGEWKRAEALAQEATLRGEAKETLQRLWRVVGDHAQWWSKRLKKRRVAVFTKVVDSMFKSPGNFQKMVSCLKKKESRGQGKCRLDTDNMSDHAAYFSSTFGAPPTGNAQLVDSALLLRTDPLLTQPCHVPAPVGDEDVDELSKVIREMPNNKAAGSDDIPGELWKVLAPLTEGMSTLARFFHLCEAVGVTPDEWKLARVVPVYKNKGDPSHISNYRPIALTQVIRRIFEKYFIMRKLADIVDKLAHTQGGFRPHRSTMDQVVILHELLCRLVRSVVIFLDIKAAYDTVDRRLLWTRMARDFKVPESTITRLRDMFDFNVIVLVIKGKESEVIPLKRGLLQGSSISPLLFNIFINELLIDLQKLPKIPLGGALWNHLFFADDGALVATNNADANKLVDKAHDWGNENGIAYAIPKCKFIATHGEWSIKMDGVPLLQVPDYKYLGIHMAPRGINFPKSLHERAEACLQMVRWMGNKGMNTSGWRLSQSITVYKSFLRSMMEYGLCLKVLLKKDVHILQKVQNAALRYMLSANKSTSIGALHIVTEIEPLASRNVEINARFFNSLLHGEKKDLPAGQLVKTLNQSKGPKASLVQTFKSSSPWIEEVGSGKLPSLPDLKKLRTVDLCKYQTSCRDAASGHLLPPRGPHKNNLLKWAYKIPRNLVKELYCFKLAKFPRQECIKCKGVFTVEHLFKCGSLEASLRELTITHDIKPLTGKGSATLHELLRRLDAWRRPPIELYCHIGEALLDAKSKTLATQIIRKEEEDFSDDDRPEDPYNILIEETLGIIPKIQQAKPKPKPRRDPAAAPEGDSTKTVDWIRGEDLRTVAPAAEKTLGIIPNTEQPETAPSTEEAWADIPIPLVIWYHHYHSTWLPSMRNLLILQFLQKGILPQGEDVFDEYFRHNQQDTIWSTADGVEAFKKWITPFRKWLMPRWEYDLECKYWRTLYRMWKIPPSLIPEDGMVLMRHAPRHVL